MRRVDHLLCLSLIIAACASDVGIQGIGTTVLAQVQLPSFGILAAPKTTNDVDHYTFQLRDNGTNALIATHKTTRTDALFNEVADGVYKLTAEAFASGDDSTSITQGGAQTSSNTVTVASPNVTYSAGGALTATLDLLDGTGESVSDSLTVNNGSAWAGAAESQMGFTNQWTNGYTAMPTVRDNLGVGVVNNKLYAIGGFDSVVTTNVVHCFNPAANSWTSRAVMPTARRSLGIGVVNGKIYAIGGVDGGDLATVEEYNPATNTWAAKAAMPTARWGLATAVVSNKIYAMGGYAGGNLTTVEEYDPVGDTWASKASMPTARRIFSAAAYNGKIYAIGGFDGSALNVVEEYDPVGNTWASKANMPTARWGTAAGVVGGHVFVAGPTATEAYNPTSNTWTTKANMLSTRQYMGSGVVGGYLFAVGGFNAGSQLGTVERYEP